MHAQSPSTTQLGTLKHLAITLAAAMALLGGVTAAARAASPGSLDSSFGNGGIARVGGDIRFFGTAFQSDGKVVAVGGGGVGSAATLVVARFTSSGALDFTFGGGVVSGPLVGTSLFGTNSIGRAVAVQSDGKIVVVGKATDPTGLAHLGVVIERFNANGTLDTGFGVSGVVDVLSGQFGDGYAVAIQPDGKIVATGSANAGGSGNVVVPRAAIVRLNTNGSLDTSFGSGGIDVIDLGPYSYASAAAVQGDGKIVIAGSQAPGLQVPNALIARLTPTGALDASFNGTGAYAHQYAQGAANSAFNALALQGDGKIVAAGAATSGNSGADALFARFDSDGLPDGSFGSGGVVYSPSAENTSVSGSAVPGVQGVAIAANGDIVGGGTDSDQGLTGIALWAFKSTGAPESGFGSDGLVMTGFGAASDGEANALAVASDGSLAAAGDARAGSGGAYSGVVTRYVGFSPPVPALKIALHGVSGNYKIATVIRNGFKATVGCNEACSIRASLVISATTARRLDIVTYGRQCSKSHGKRRCVKTHAFRSVSVASANGKLSKAGLKVITLKLNRSFEKTLIKQKNVRLTLQVSVTSTATHRVFSTLKALTFKR